MTSEQLVDHLEDVFPNYDLSAIESKYSIALKNIYSTIKLIFMIIHNVMLMESVYSNCLEMTLLFFFRRTNLCWGWIFSNMLKHYEVHWPKELVYQNSEEMVHPNLNPQAQEMV
jgi:hypothetical protein